MPYQTPQLPEWLHEMLPFDHEFVDAGAGRMHVMHAGRGPTVVLTHGNPTWGFLNRKVAGLLRHDFHVVMPDLLGFGLSDKPHDAGVHTLRHHARWFDTCLRAMGVERAIFVGQDWGGPIGFLGAFANPERVAGLVVLNTALWPPRPGFRPTAFHRFSRVPGVSDVVFRYLEFPQAYLAWAQGDKSSIHGLVRQAYRWPLKSREHNVAPLALARMVPDNQNHPSIPELQRLEQYITQYTGPAAIVWGTKDPILGRLLRRARRALPQAKVWETKAGHFLQEEVPQTIADAVRHVAEAE